MEMSQVHTLVATVGAHASGCADAGVLRARLTDIRRLSAWLEASRLRIVRDLAGVSSFPEKDVADTSQTSVRDAARVTERAAATAANPALGTALAAGDLTVGHVDLLTAETAKLSTPEKKAELTASTNRFIAAARTATFEQFRDLVARERARIDASDGMDLLDRQRRATRLRSWIDRRSGMWHLSGAFDPLTGAQIAQLFDRTMRRLFAERTPDGAPADPAEKQDFLRAHALKALLLEGGAGDHRGGRPQAVFVIDGRTDDGNGQPLVDFGLDAIVPFAAVQELLTRSDHHHVVVRNGVVLSAPGNLDLGRNQRLPNRAQRRVLRALYPTCAIPGCNVRFNHLKVHHIRWWRNGGFTNLDNLVPLCNKHHHAVHDDGWVLAMAPDRTLTINLPDGTIMTTGPPTRSAG